MASPDELPEFLRSATVDADISKLNTAEFWLTFFKETDWTEPWLQGLLAFHVFCLLTIVLTRHLLAFQAIFFSFLGCLALSAEWLNEQGALHWEEFSRQQYFDSHGLFITIMFSTPILINCIVMLVLWLIAASSMLVKVKRAELAQRQEAPAGAAGQKPEAKKDK